MDASQVGKIHDLLSDDQYCIGNVIPVLHVAGVFNEFVNFLFWQSVNLA